MDNKYPFKIIPIHWYIILLIRLRAHRTFLFFLLYIMVHLRIIRQVRHLRKQPLIIKRNTLEKKFFFYNFKRLFIQLCLGLIYWRYVFSFCLTLCFFITRRLRPTLLAVPPTVLQYCLFYYWEDPLRWFNFWHTNTIHNIPAVPEFIKENIPQR